ncbi:DUF6498-containing protein [Afipia carboxidovorans]|uniref:DUF6498-containing protein n=1 Tax=Afipia carboxidovorans TaxID=40137 RepID=UPI003090F4B6|nr:hypothetical protein CRBSH125_24920 [Afipia carboxidovorans]
MPGETAATSLLILSNLIPIAGIALWGWDAFVLLCLYWLETAIIGFWIMVHYILLSHPPGSLTVRAVLGAMAICSFFVFHASIFMSVHMGFLWALFAGDWAKRIHTPTEAVHLLLIGEALWIPLAMAIVGQGGMTLIDLVRRFVLRRPVTIDTAGLVTGFYKRILLMHAAIMIGAFVALKIGSTGPLVVLVLLKTMVEFVVLFRMRRDTGTTVTSKK